MILSLLQTSESLEIEFAAVAHLVEVHFWEKDGLTSHNTTTTTTQKLHDTLELLNLLPALYVTMQEAATLYTYRIVESFWQSIE